LTNGREFYRLYRNTEVYAYLQYTHKLAIQALRADESLTFPVSDNWSDWTFNLNTGHWLYDPTFASIKYWERSSDFSPVPLPQGTRPQLDVDAIAAYFERVFGSMWYLITSFGKTWKGGLSAYAPHGLLTFGAVVRYLRDDVLAHFPSTPCPEWHFESRSHNIKATYSNKVFARVDLEFTTSHDTQVNLRFSMRIPLDDRDRLRAAYLSQHDSSTAGYTRYLVDEIGFSIVGSFDHTPPTRLPIYLFVPPLCTEYINGMHCLRIPLPDFFYWTSDPEGRVRLPKEGRGRYCSGIPNLQVETYIGSIWWPSDLEVVTRHLRNKGYESNGRQYARDHGYPELIQGDPHVKRMVELEFSDDDKPLPSESQLTSPSTFSLVDTPTKPETVHEEKRSIPAFLVKGFGLWTRKNAVSPEAQLKTETTSVNSESPTGVRDEWDLVDSEDL
ncbi:hypothetical protein PQX77_003222, partial [Marasmius sp. AFHP31]